MLVDADHEVRLAPTDFFFKGLLPKLPKGTSIAKIKRKLIAQGQLNRKGTRWTNWSKKPSQHTAVEDSVFTKFQTLIEDIQNAWSTTVDPKHNIPATLKVVCNPTKTPGSTTNASSSKPDCYGIKYSPGQPTDTDDWVDITIPSEFKKDEDPRTENDVCLDLTPSKLC